MYAARNGLLLAYEQSTVRNELVIKSNAISWLTGKHGAMFQKDAHVLSDGSFGCAARIPSC